MATVFERNRQDCNTVEVPIKKQKRMDPVYPKEILHAKAKKWELDITDREFAIKLDENDQLAYLREHFEYPKCGTLPMTDDDLVGEDEDCVYFCGNSLGLMPRKTPEVLKRELQKWANMGVYGHFTGEMPWAFGDEDIRKESARIVGAKVNEVVLMNALTINQHLLLISFYTPTVKRHKIMLESKAFPSDHYAIESQIRHHGFKPEESMICLEPREGEATLRTEDIIQAIEEHGHEIAVILFSGVQYYTGQVFDMEKITKAGHKMGCYVGFDLAHAVGNVEIKLHEWKVDFAIWCTYKYLNSGAGGIGGAFIHESIDTSQMPRLAGWWSHKFETRFLMDNKMDFAEGAAGYKVSNPSMLLCASLQASLEIFSKTSIAQLRAKSILLTGYLEVLLQHYYKKPEGDDESQPYITILTPSNPAERGCQLSVEFSLPINEVFNQLEKHGVVCDKREPSVLRLAPTPLYNSFSDVHKFVKILGECFTNLRD